MSTMKEEANRKRIALKLYIASAEAQAHIHLQHSNGYPAGVHHPPAPLTNGVGNLASSWAPRAQNNACEKLLTIIINNRELSGKCCAIRYTAKHTPPHSVYIVSFPSFVLYPPRRCDLLLFVARNKKVFAIITKFCAFVSVCARASRYLRRTIVMLSVCEKG